MLLAMIFVTNDYDLYFNTHILPCIIILGVFVIFFVMGFIRCAREERELKEQQKGDAEALEKRYKKINEDFAKDIGLDKHK